MRAGGEWRGLNASRWRSSYRTVFGRNGTIARLYRQAWPRHRIHARSAEALHVSYGNGVEFLRKLQPPEQGLERTSAGGRVRDEIDISSRWRRFMGGGPDGALTLLVAFGR